MKRALWTALICLGLIAAGQAATPDQVLRLERISPRVLLLTENSPMENLVVAIATARGLVVVDTFPSPVTAALARKMIAETFGRQDFTHLILTHGHWDHAYGGQVYAGATVIGHEFCRNMMQEAQTNPGRIGEAQQRRAAELEKQLAALSSDAPDRNSLENQLAFAIRNRDGFGGTFTPLLPGIMFNDSLKLDMGDLTLELVFFGRAHSGADIFIRIPQEGLLITGDIFLDRGWLPLFAGQPRLDIPRWIEVINTMLTSQPPLQLVIPGHREPWKPEKLALWRDYIVKRWKEVQAGKEKGEDLATIQQRLPLEPEFEYLKGLGHPPERLQRYNNDNIRAFWNQLFEPASELIAQVMEKEGVQAAKAKFKELQSAAPPVYRIDEAQFNQLGYRLLGRGRLPEAIAVLEMNVLAFPASWNAYDSLAEALAQAGQRSEAIRNYRKSLELNPGNTNGQDRLKELEKAGR